MIQKYDFLTCDFEYIFKFKKGEEKFDKLWQMKASARESLKDWLLVTDISPQISEICANACSELIENCIKYTQDETTAVVAIHATNTVITVETINPTKQNHCFPLSEYCRDGGHNARPVKIKADEYKPQ